MNNFNNDVKLYLSIVFQKPVNDFHIIDINVYSKFYRAFALMFDYRLSDIIIEFNKFKRITSSNIVTIDMLNKLEMFKIIPTVIPDTTRIKLCDFKPLH